MRHQRRPAAVMLALAIYCLTSVVTALPAGASSDPLWPSQWALTQIGAPQSWSRTTGAGILIGVVDTGVDANHEDLAGKVIASTSCVGSRGDPSACGGSGQDDHGHGTHVSAIAAATTDNNRGIAGVAPGARLVVAKALTSNGGSTPTGSVADLNAGIRWVVDRGARVVNLSVGGDWSRTNSAGAALSEGIAYAWSRGAIPVLAAGNDPLGLGQQVPDYREIDAVVVGASDPSGNVASYSSRLDTARWGLVAPGGAGGDPGQPETYARANVVSAWSNGHGFNGYAVAAGTSMAAAHVSGALAQLLAQGLGPEIAVQHLLATASTATGCGAGCHGRLDVARATGAPASSSAGRVVGALRPVGNPGSPPPATGTVRVPPPPRPSPPKADPPPTTIVPVADDLGTGGDAEVAIAIPPPTFDEPLPGRPLARSGGGDPPVPAAVTMLAMVIIAGGSLLHRQRRRTPPGRG